MGEASGLGKGSAPSPNVHVVSQYHGFLLFLYRLKAYSHCVICVQGLSWW